MKKLNPKILEVLKKKTEAKEKVLRVRISEIRRDKPFLTMNAAAYLYAQKKNISVARYLSEEDRKSLEKIELEKMRIKLPVSKRKQIIEIAKFDTNNKFLETHIDEINKTYTYGCYTACFVLMRKVLENLIIEILKKKYPGKEDEHRKKYLDFNRNRSHDFNVLLQNLRDSSKDFGTERKIVERICQLSECFKEKANEMAHSLYHIATKKEIEENNFQDILDLIKEFNEKHFDENKLIARFIPRSIRTETRDSYGGV